MSSEASDVSTIVEQARDLLAGKPPELQGAVLADLLAIWLAGDHPRAARLSMTAARKPVIPESNGWGVFPHEVMPNNDLRQHQIGCDCWCDPYFDDLVLVHNSLDDRKAYERTPT